MRFGNIRFASVILAGSCLLNLALACGGERVIYLEGSIDKRFDLEFDTVTVKRDENTLRIIYQRQMHYSEISYDPNNTIAELVVNNLSPDVKLKEWIDITTEVELYRYVIVLEEPFVPVQDIRQYPDVHAAQIMFGQLGTEAGKMVSGSFRTTFIDGSTLRGGFSDRL